MNTFRCSPTLLAKMFLAMAFFAVAFLLPGGAQASDQCKRMVVSGNPEYPPYLWRDPDDDTHLIGAAADLMQIVAKELGIAIEVRYVGPWGRVQEETSSGTSI